MPLSLFDDIFHWKSKKQITVALSSTNASYIYYHDYQFLSSRLKHMIDIKITANLGLLFSKLIQIKLMGETSYLQLLKILH